MKKIYINLERLETRVALVENDVLIEYEVERYDQQRLVGSIFKGKINNLENSLQAAFVNIGYEKNAFLHYWDMLAAADLGMYKKAETASGDLDTKMDFEEELKKTKNSNKTELEKIPELFPVGSDVLVQVTKGPIGTKGPRVTTSLSIAGRYLVLLPYTNHVGVSKKIVSRKERDRLKKILKNINLPKNMGVICRTVGEGKKDEYFKADIKMLLETWGNFEKSVTEKKAPYCVYREPNIINRSTRFFLTDDVDEIIIDNKKAYSNIKHQIKQYSDTDTSRLKLYNEPKPLFQRFNLTKQIESIFNRQVSLPSGGYLCIDETEALISIDINSGKARQGRDHPETILNTNIESAIEIARQIKLRDIGGLIVVDFIDMRSKKDQMSVYRTLKNCLQSDRARTKVIPISQLGLLEMTRQREHESLQDAIFTDCPYCSGKGIVKSNISVSVEIQRKLQELLKKSRKSLEIRVVVNPEILSRLKDRDAHILNDMEQSLGGNLSFRADPDMHIEEFKFIDPKTQREYR